MTRSRKTRFHPVQSSLADLAGWDYLDAVCNARAWLTGERLRELRALANERVDFFPESLHRRLIGLLGHMGQTCCPKFDASAVGVTSAQFRAHTKAAMSPLSGLGYFRVGEDGRLYLVAKSEHYHVSMGHAFPGYRLLEHARRLGIPNATHNNTRGHITRLLEEKLAATAGRLDRVLNLQTGSLAVEAALKMMLARFYRIAPDAPSPPQAGQPPYSGRTPVLAVIGDDEGALQANYHGTTVLTQMLRGMWPEFLRRMEPPFTGRRKSLLLVRPVRPNSLADLDALFSQYDRTPFKLAGFLHELVMMNYGARCLSKTFVRRLHALCRRHDVPTLVDEIQSCAWAPDLLLFREYGIHPTFVAVGKGFTGGEYAASRLLFSSTMDSLPQFGALVTNGQEELASLSYLITIRWAEANADVTRAVGEYYEARLKELAARHRNRIDAVEGKRHLAGMRFHDLPTATRFAQRLVAEGLDISVQTYKADYLPSALTKLPLIAGYEVADTVVEHMAAALADIERPRG